MPFFSSFDDAWSWFAGGGALVTLDEQRATFTGGRAQYLAFAVIVRDPAVFDLALDMQDALEGVEGLMMTPEDSLHVTVRGAGFQVIEKRRDDDLLREDVGRIAAAAERIIARVPPIDVKVGPMNVFPDALILEVHDDGELAELRERLAGTGARDASALAEAPYLPHITIAAFRTAAVADVLRERLPGLREREPVRATFRRIELARAWFTGIEAEEAPEIDVVRSFALRG